MYLINCHCLKRTGVGEEYSYIIFGTIYTWKEI